MPMPAQVQKPQKLLTIIQVADTLSVSTKTVRRMIDSGQLHSHRVRRIIRVSWEDLRAYTNSTRQ
jgi:excisionase family DNA binding protein